jgi:hypothetical protein
LCRNLLPKQLRVEAKRLNRLFTKNTGLCETER